MAGARTPNRTPTRPQSSMSRRGSSTGTPTPPSLPWAVSTPSLDCRPRRTSEQKVQEVLEKLKDLNWTLSEFLHALFRVKDAEGTSVRREQSPGVVCQKFLSGRTLYKPIDIIQDWLTHPGGRFSANSDEAELMYSLDVPYQQIKSVRPAITSMAIQLVKARLEKKQKYNR